MHVVFRLHPGGMEHGVVKLVNGLPLPQVQSSICATSPGGSLRELVRPEVPVFELRRRDGNDPVLVWRLYRLFRRERPDIVHTHAWGTLVEGWMAARLAGVPIVVHGEHGTLQAEPRQIAVQRRIWGRVDHVLSVSSRLAEKLSAVTGFPLARIEVIRNGVDLSRFGSTDRAAARAALGIAADAFVVGTAGRLVPVKDHATLLEALARMAGEGRSFLAVIAGDGPLRAELATKAAALGIADRVRLLGHQPDIERVFAALDVFVLSSVSEGLSNTILEAMASGVAVVATRVGGADELVVDGETGVLVPSQAPDAMARAISALGDDEGLRQRMAAAGRRRATEEFGIARMVENYAAFYRRVGARLERPSGAVAAEPVVTEHTAPR
jgi:sugar transferase (PEP-CTERM/EpsH1 system associated)